MLDKKILNIEITRKIGLRKIILGKIRKKLFIGIYDLGRKEVIYEDLFLPSKNSRCDKRYWKTLHYNILINAIKKLDELKTNPEGYIDKFFPKIL